MKDSIPYARDSLIQVYGSPNAYPFCVEFDINRTRVAERYYSRNLNIDESNCTRQDDLQLERKLQTKDCSIKVNTLILGTNGVDICYFGKVCEWWDDKNLAKFHCNLTEHIIDNQKTGKRPQRNKSGKPIEYHVYIRNIDTRFTPTKKKMEIYTPNCLVDTKFLEQSKLKVCRAKTTYVCSSCGD